MRRRRAALKVVKALDAFPKVQDDYQRPTTRGGTLSLLALLLIAFLVVSEFFYYRATELRYKYSVDTDLESKLLLRVDMTIGMPCEFLGVDIIDLSGESISVAKHMKLEPASFDLTEEEMLILEAKRSLVAGDGDPKSLNDLPIVDIVTGKPKPVAMPMGEVGTKRMIACRLHGKIEVKKVAGNFHITTGRTVPHPQGHAHLNVLIPKDLLNFSHRIDHLSFGLPVPGAVNPLDGVLKIAPEGKHVYQYYLRIVPTKFNTFHRSMSTNQYSVTERNRTLDHRKGSHGVAGIFFKYDMNAMMVEIKEERRPFWQFLVRLCGIIGGVFATSGMLNALIGSFTEGVMSRVSFGSSEETDPVTKSPETWNGSSTFTQLPSIAK